MPFKLRLCILLLFVSFLTGCSIFFANIEKTHRSPPAADSEHFLLSAERSPSAVFDKAYESQMQALRQYRQKVLTVTQTDLYRDKPEGSLNNMLADMVRWHVARKKGREIDVSFIPFHMIRDTLLAGPVRVGDIYRIMPQDRAMTLYEVNGVVLKQLADTIAVRGGGSVSGMRMRTTEGGAQDVLIGSEAVEWGAWYRLVAPAGLFCSQQGVLVSNSDETWSVEILNVQVPLIRKQAVVRSQVLLDSEMRDMIMQYLSNQDELNRNRDQRIR